MYKLGTIVRANEVGKKGLAKLIWCACLDCGKERWVQIKWGKPESLRCNSCARRIINKSRDYKPRYGKDSPGWKCGKIKTSQGYILVLVNPKSPYISMADRNRYIPEHRLIMAEYLNRPLLKIEHVHHINGVKTDNRIDNLELLSPTNHNLKTQLCSSCELRKEIRLLRFQVKELTRQLQGELL